MSTNHRSITMIKGLAITPLADLVYLVPNNLIQ